MGYRHGIYSREVPTSLNPPTIIDGNSGLVVAFGTAPTHLAANPAKANTPILTYYYNEAVSQLGYSDDYDYACMKRKQLNEIIEKGEIKEDDEVSQSL